MAYKITWKEKGTVLECSGSLSIQEINEANGILQSDPKRCKKSVVCQAMQQHRELQDNPRMSSLFSRCHSWLIAVYPQAA